MPLPKIKSIVPKAIFRNRNKKIKDKVEYDYKIKGKLIGNQEDYENAIKEMKKDLKDFIGTFHVNPDFDNHIEITSVTKKYMRSLFVVGTGTSSTFHEYLRNLYVQQKTNVSIYINPMAQSKAKKELKKMLDEYEINLRNAKRGGNNGEINEYKHKLAETQKILDELHAGVNKLFKVNIYFTIQADSIDELDYVTKELDRKLSNNEINIESAFGKQVELFKSGLPLMNNKFGNNYDPANQLFDRRSLGTTYPFIVGDVGHDRGTIFGQDVHTGKPILLNEFYPLLPNPHMTIVGLSGKGKSFGIKQFTARETIRYGLETMCFDVEGEFLALAEILGGLVINFNKDLCINIFDVNPEIIKDSVSGKEKEIIDIDTKLAVVESDILTLITGANAPTGDQFYQLLSEEIRFLTQQLYHDFEITRDPKSLYEKNIFTIRGKKKRKLPTLSDFYKLVEDFKHKINDPESDMYDPNMSTIYTYLQRMLRKYCKIAGGNFTYFDGQTSENAQLTNNKGEFSPFTCFNLSTIPENYLPQVIKVLMSFTWETFVKKNSEDPLKAKRRTVLIDEAFRLMPYDAAVKFMDDMARRARKRHVSFRVVTQKVKDFYGSVEKESILTNSAIQILFGQAEGEINEVTEIFGLNEVEKNLVLDPQKGHCLLIVDREKIEMQVERHDFEKSFLESDVIELGKIKREKQEKEKLRKRKLDENLLADIVES